MSRNPHHLGQDLRRSTSVLRFPEGTTDFVCFAPVSEWPPERPLHPDSESTRSTRPFPFRRSARRRWRLLRVLAASTPRRSLSDASSPPARSSGIRLRSILPVEETDRHHLQIVYSSTKTSPKRGCPLLHTPPTITSNHRHQVDDSPCGQPIPARCLVSEIPTAVPYADRIPLSRRRLTPARAAPLPSRKKVAVLHVDSMNSRSSAWTRFLPTPDSTTTRVRENRRVREV
jgi:hypothetical protein